MQPVSLEELKTIEQTLFREARFLNQREPRQWLETLVHPDIHYWLPIEEDRYRNDKRPPPSPDEPGIYNDRYRDLDERVRRLETGLVWMEDPPSRIRYLITNIEAYQGETPDNYQVYSNFFIYRNRRQRDETMLVGGRDDTWVRDGNGLKLLRRRIHLDQRVVLDKNLYIFL